MGDRSTIEWTDATWNPIRGVQGTWHCTKVSPGCEHCYAERMNVRRGGPEFKVGADTLRLDEGVLSQPLRWKRPRRVFVCSMTDLFHEDVPDVWIGQVFCVMAQAKQHTFQVLTKRAKRMRKLLSEPPLSFPVGMVAGGTFPHIWLGVSVEDQKRFDERWPALAQTPAAVRFLSVEPLLGPVDLSGAFHRIRSRQHTSAEDPFQERIHWVIVGGESGGPPERALVERTCWVHDRGVDGSPCMYLGRDERCDVRLRPKENVLEWVRSLRDQCVAAKVPFFFKQWGGLTPKSGGRLLDGRTWDEYPS